MDLYTQQKLLIYDLYGEKCNGEEERHIVHTQGLWHMSSVAYFLSTDQKDKIRVLVQKRSGNVDLSKGLYDQSLATQRRNIDDSPRTSLLRRAEEEYGFDLSKSKLNQYFKNIGVTASKISPGEQNREILNFFLSHIEEEKIQSKNLHVGFVSEAIWFEWGEMIHQIKNNPLLYTRTARLFCLNDEIVNYIEKCIQSMLYDLPLKEDFPATEIHFESVNPSTEEIYIQRKDGTVDWYQYDKKTTKLLKHEQKDKIVRS